MTNLLLLIVVMVDVKSVLTEQGEQSNRMKKILEQSMIELKEMMKKQEDRIKVLEDCNGKYTRHRSFKTLMSLHDCYIGQWLYSSY